MNKIRYSISLIYGEFHIVRLTEGEVAESWTSGGGVETYDDLLRVMSNASEHIDLSLGGDTAIAFEHDSNTHEFLEIPAMVKRDLEKYLERHVQREKPFQQEAAWCYHSARSGNKSAGVLLHLLPKKMIDNTVSICKRYYLNPRRLVALTEVVSARVPFYQEKAEAVLLVIALFSERTEIVVCRGDGEVLLVRELSFGYEQDSERFATDINRTVRYSKQRMGGGADSAWLIGVKANEIIDTLQIDIEVTLHVDPEGLAPTFWASQVAGLSHQLNADFIPRGTHQFFDLQLLRYYAMVVGAVLLVAAIGIGTGVELIIRSYSSGMTTARADIDTLNQSIKQRRQEIDRAYQKVDHLNHLRADALNLPALFVSHLGDLIPDGLVINFTSIDSQDSQWNIVLSGVANMPFDQTVELLSEFEQVLASAPWHIQVDPNWRQNWYQQFRSGSAVASADKGFKITGVMR